MLARDQSRLPSGRSMRFTSSPVNGAYSRATPRNRSPIYLVIRLQPKALTNEHRERRKALAQRFFMRNYSAPRRSVITLGFLPGRYIDAPQHGERGGFLARVANLVQFFVPVFHA